MIDINKLRESKGYMLAIINTKTGEYEPVSEDVMPVRHAKWVYEGKFYYSDNNTHNTWSCSGCGCSEFTPTRFCPNCGAKMDKE